MENVAQENEKAISGAIKIDEKEIRTHLDGLVRQSVEKMQNALMNADEQRSQTHWSFVAEPGWSAAFRMGSRLWCWSEPGSGIFPRQNGALGST